MRGGRFPAILLGAVTVAPLAYLVVFLAAVAPKVLSFGSPTGIGEAQYFALMRITYWMHAVVIITTFGLVAFYAILANRSDALPRENRPLWTFLLLAGNIVVMPVFWYLFVWNKRRQPDQTRME